VHVSAWQPAPQVASLRTRSLLGTPVPQEVELSSCSFAQPSPTVPLPLSVKRVSVWLGSGATGIDFGPQATGLEEGEP